MPKQRLAIPSKIKEAVLKEFSHQCAICGHENPHLHHIDEDPSNNTVLNLIPLCPNCHLSDHHNPTGKIDIEILRLFRKYKDPYILKPQFEPLFDRLRFILSISNDVETDKLRMLAAEAVAFINEFEMGRFYSHEIQKLMSAPSWAYVISIGAHSQEDERRRDESLERRRTNYIQQLRDNSEKVFELLVEMIRYQDWK